MKKFLSITFAALLLMSSIFAEKKTEPNIAKDFEYSLDENGTGIKIIRFKGKFKDIIIPETIDGKKVVQIGDGNNILSSFSKKIGRTDVDKLPSITIPSSVTKIGSRAFENYGGKLIFADFKNISKFGDYAFYYCSQLTEKITISSNTEIGLYAFIGSGITEVEFIDTPFYISNSAFVECENLASVSFNKNITKITQEMIPLTAQSIKISSNVKEIDRLAFKDFTGTFVFENFENIKKFESYAFYNCKNLPKKLIFGEDVEIGEYAFAKNSITELEFLERPKFLAENAFYDCSFYGNSQDSLKKIGYYDFKFPEGTTEIPARFYQNNKSEFRGGGIIIPASVTEIGDSAFTRFNGTITFEKFENIKKIGDFAFYHCEGLTGKIVIGDDVEIGKSAFSSTNITEIEFAKNVTKITKNMVFTSEQTLVIPASVTEIGDNAFADFNGTLLFENFENIKKIGDKAFYNCKCSTEKITFGEGVEIGREAFWNFSGALSFENFENIKKIDDFAFQSCKSLPEKITLGEGIEIGKLAFANTGITEICFNGNPKSINDKAFYTEDHEGGYEPLKLENVIFGESVTEIAREMFNGFSETTFIFEKFENIKKIGDYAFCNCKGLTQRIVIGDDVEIGASAFYGSGITKVEFLGTPKSIDRYAFGDCKSLVGKVTFCEGVEIGDYAFNGSGITEVEFLGTPKFIGRNVFPESSLSEETKIMLKHAGVSDFANVLEWCIEPTPESDFLCNLTEDGTGAIVLAYKGTSNSILIPETIEGFPVVAIGKSAFGHEDSFDVKSISVTVPSSVKYIYANAFARFEGKLKFLCPENITKIYGGAFFEFKGELDLNGREFSLANIKYIGTEAFYRCDFIKGKLIIPATCYIGSAWHHIKNGAFENCNNITEVEFEEGFEEIGYYLFLNCRNIEKVTFPTSIKDIYDEAFAGCVSLKEIIIPESCNCKFNYTYIFNACPNLNLKSKKSLIEHGYSSNGF